MAQQTTITNDTDTGLTVGDHFPGLELDATAQARSDNDNASTQRATLVRAVDGQVAFPSIVPPLIQSPEDSMNPKRLTVADDGSKIREDAQQQTSDSSRGAAMVSSHASRPVAEKRWQTDLPMAGDRRYGGPPPMPKRAGTSYLNRAIREGSRTDEESSSSSSEDEEGDESGQFHRGGADQQNGTNIDKNKQKNARHRALAKTDNDGQYSRFRVGNENYETKGKVKKDGRLRITVNETANTGYLAKALGAAVNKVVPMKEAEKAARNRSTHKSRTSSSSAATLDIEPRPRLNIVIMVIGSRGDAQPFLKIGKVLKEDFGHRVRIATHPAFREFVERDSGLEFFSVGGDPSELMAFMVKNPGLIPTLESVKAGDIGRRRAAMAEMFDGFWRACINATDDEKDSQNLKMMGVKDPFVADAIIANPPSFAHIHCAEALGIPVHLMFTFPYTPTQAFPHPLASIKRSNVDPGYTNFISYPLVEMMVWQGLGDLVNDFRVKTLALDPVSTLWAPGATYRLHVPFTYLWSPTLVPKPQDWGSEIDISGFVFLDLASTFEPPQELEQFLAAGDTPIYIGFGSIVVDDADRFTQMIFEAVELAGVRAVVSKGWGGLGGDQVPENIFMLDNTPHDWLFPKVKACVIHGGAGTTAIAVKCGKPTMVVPFFGDQHFWGAMLDNSGAGPKPIPYKYLNAENLAEGIKYCLGNKAKESAAHIARSIEEEGDGAVNAVKAFHRHLNLKGPGTMRCSILKDQIAVWEPKNTDIRLSPVAADILVDRGLINWKQLRLLRHTEWNDFEGPGEPVTGVASSLASTFGDAFTGIGSVPYRVVKTKRRQKAKKERRRLQRMSNTEPQKPGKKIHDEALPDIPNGHIPGSNNADANSIHTDTTAGDAAEQYVDDVTRGVGKSATAIAKAPIDLSVALAQGFHNAPRLYGDDTVRRPPRVTGFHSGLRAARFEFVYGIYDGFTGVVRLPVRGAKAEGVLGCVKGTGMGLSGFFLKNLAAIVGPFGYTLKGIVKQAERSKQPRRLIRRARITQGQREVKLIPDEKRKKLENEVIESWHILQELCDKIKDGEHERGIVGQLDRVLFQSAFMFEDMEVATSSLEALKRGETLESLVNPAQESGHSMANKNSNDDKSASLRKSLNVGRKNKDSHRSSL